MGLATQLRSHLLQNYWMTDRLPEFRQILLTIRDAGYRFTTVAEFAQEALQRRRFAQRLCVLRIDVDSDPDGAGRIFDVANDLGLPGTYYFRLSTIDAKVVRRIAGSGSEVGYHFEEIATAIKGFGLRNKRQVEASLAIIRQEFRRNISLFHDKTGVWPRTIAAHGDFLNRRLRITNDRLIDRALLGEFNILAETNEPWLAHPVSARISDRPAPSWWHPESPVEALKRMPDVLYLLVHPRQWVPRPLLNTGLDLLRVGAEIQYRWRSWRARPSEAAELG